MVRTFQPISREPVEGAAFALPIDRPVAVYYRQSSLGQVGNISTAIQTIDMAVELQRRGWDASNILLIDMDAGVSGTTKIDERDGMRQLFNLITSDLIGAVACQDEDRLFRDVTQIQVNIFIEACRKHRVQVITPTVVYVFHDPQQGDFYRRQFRFKCEMAAEYLSSFIVGRLGRARKRLLNEGKWSGARVPIGYMVDIRRTVDGLPNPNYKKFVPFEPFAQVIREYFRVFVEMNGSIVKTYRAIQDRAIFYPIDTPIPDGFKVNYFISPKTKRYPNRRTIERMMSNPVYLGHWLVNGVVTIYNNHEPIVPEDLFYAAFNMVSEYNIDGTKNPNYRPIFNGVRPHRERDRPVEKPVLDGLLYTPSRDGGLFRLGAWYVKYDQRYFYTADEKPYFADGQNWRREAEWIDDQIITRLLEKIRRTYDPELWVEEAQAKQADKVNEVDRLTAQIEALERAMAEIVENLTTIRLPTLVKQLEDRYSSMEAEREVLIARREVAKAEQDKQETDDELRAQFQKIPAAWDTLSREEKRTIALVFIDKVIVSIREKFADMEGTIYWRDNTSEDITIRRKSADCYTYTDRELAELRRLVQEGATQLEIAAALPTKTWRNIRRRIKKEFGKGVKIKGMGKLRGHETYQEIYGSQEVGIVQELSPKLDFSLLSRALAHF